MTRPCKCLDECEYVKYNTKVNRFLEYVLSKSFVKFFFFNIFLFFSTFVTQCYIWFHETKFYPFVKEQAFGFFDFIGSLGGLMGLFAGISVISIVEVLFHIFDVVADIIKDKRHRSKIKPAWNVPKTNLLNQDHVLYHFLKFVETFFIQSDIHGLHYLIERGISRFVRLFWVIVVSSSIVCCAFLVADVIKTTSINPIEFSVDEKSWTSSDVSLKFAKYK